MPRVGRNRIKHRRWPKGWAPGPVRKDGTFDIYFRPTNAGDKAIVKAITGGPMSLRLGATEDEASTKFATLVVGARRRDAEVIPGTVAEIFDLARREFLPSLKNEKTRAERERHIDALDQAFGAKHYAKNVYDASRDNAGRYLRAMDVQKRIFEGRATRHASVNREARTGELVFQWARAPWGLTEYNPFAGLMANDETHRKVVPTDEGIFKLYRWLDPPARFMVVLIRYYGRRKVEQLALELTDAKDDGIHMRRGKDAEAKPIILKWDPRLRRAYARLLRWREEVIRPTKGKRRAPRVVSTAMILNRRGRRYTESGFNSARRRAMARAKIKGAFTFHDIRKSRAETLTLAQAVNVLAHDDPRTTAVKYRPGAIVVDLNDEVAAKRRGNGKA
jgi:hypothetical protein